MSGQILINLPVFLFTYNYTMKKSGFVFNLFLFIITMAIAWYEQWTAKDLLWSLWISSLTLGYSFIVVIIIANALNPKPMGRGFRKEQELSEKEKEIYKKIELKEKDNKIAFEG